MAVDRNSGTWSAVSNFCGSGIDQARDRLEARAMAQTDTEFERGYIMALRHVLAMAETKPDLSGIEPVRID